MGRARALQTAVDPLVDWTLPLQTRAHALPERALGRPDVFLKRDDETGFGISGPKLRKYASLLPFLERNGYRQAAVIGGAYANNVYGLAQLLRERGLGFRLFLRGAPGEAQAVGGHLLVKLLADAGEIEWIPRADWPQAYRRALAWAEAETLAGRPTLPLPEGAAHPAVLPGAATLSLDMLRNEAQHRRRFAQVVIDAGSGATAAAFILSETFLQTGRRLHIVLTAGTAENLAGQIARFRPVFERMTGVSLGALVDYRTYAPAIAPAYGRVDGPVLEACVRWARATGLLFDPVYMVKTMETARQILAGADAPGPALIIHSGGGPALFGYAEGLARAAG